MYIKEIDLAGRKLTIETGRMAKQASGSVVMQYGETVVLVTATSSVGDEVDRGFFPLPSSWHHCSHKTALRSYKQPEGSL